MSGRASCLRQRDGAADELVLLGDPPAWPGAVHDERARDIGPTHARAGREENRTLGVPLKV
jgi:hypothetical protein